MRDVIELRVHGVGGGSPESLLGVSADETVRVAGEGSTGFWARRTQRSVEGYWWGRLTSAPLLQPLWIALLPFTLLNVAGWMHQPLEDRTKPTHSWWAVRWTLWLLAYLLTAVYAAWIGVLLIDLLLVQWWRDGQLTLLVLAGAAGVAVAALWILFKVARHVQVGYEGKRPPDGVVKASKRRDDRAKDSERQRFAGERDVAAASFWLHESSAKGLLVRHTLVAGLVVLVPIGLAALRMSPGASTAIESLDYGALVSWLLRCVVAMLVVLVALTVAERIRFDRAKLRLPDVYVRTTRSGFRHCAQAVAATFAVGLAVGGFSGVERLLRDRIGAAGNPYQDLDVAFGVAAIVFVVVVAWRIAVHFLTKRKILAGLRRAAAVRARTKGGRQISPAMLNRAAWARSLSEALRNIDRVLTIPALCFLAAAVPAAFGFLASVPRAAPIAAQIADLGGSIILLGMSTILVFLWRESRRDAVRRQVGMIWDVLTFWPRRTHPWAIRPYAERAVPELQERLCHHVKRDRYVILSAHSQGTVIAVAALAQLVEIDPAVAGRIALVTYGSPIAQLYQRFFPAYFHEPLTSGLRAQLSTGDITPEIAWRNLYRETDYVGKAVFTNEESATVDRVLDDPAEQPLIDELPLADVVASSPDPIREAFTALALHSDYNGEIELRAWVDQLRSHLGGHADDVRKRRQHPPRPTGAQLAGALTGALLVWPSLQLAQRRRHQAPDATRMGQRSSKVLGSRVDGPPSRSGRGRSRRDR